MSAGKGSSPRNLGSKFRENWDSIFGKQNKIPDPDQDIHDEIERILREEPADDERHNKLCGLSFAKAGRMLARRNAAAKQSTTAPQPVPQSGRTVPPHPDLP
jgi:hypothetical protein